MVKTNLTTSIISNKKFNHTPNGYDPLEVDTMLDLIVKDYEQVSSNVVLTKEEYEDILNKIKTLEKDVEVLAVELKKEKTKSGFVKTTAVNQDNYELLLRIGKLETIIYKKLHMSDKQIENFDPDDC